MEDTAKYLIHADITADGVVERSDVVGAVFGQTEGLLGDDLDLRDLQQSSKVGRIDVNVESENGQSFGTITIASSLDKVETAILAASLETIQRVGPCRATASVSNIEDVRAAKRREVVERAKELLSSSFDESVMTSDEILEEVRRSVRVEDITDYEGLPAGPNVTNSDAIIVVEGRADVLTLLRYGIKNAVAVEGTNVPDAVAELTRSRTTTAFLDSDRGGDLILKELGQVGDIDYVATAPRGRSVEDLSRDEVMAALRSKRPSDDFDDGSPVTAATDGSTLPAPESNGTNAETPVEPGAASVDPDAPVERDDEARPDGTDAGTDAADSDDEPAGHEPAEPQSEREPETLRNHVRTVVDEGSGSVRLLDEDFATLAETAAAEAFDAIEGADEVPFAVVLDGTLDQRTLDVAAQRGVEQIIAREEGEFVKKPTAVRILTADRL